MKYEICFFAVWTFILLMVFNAVFVFDRLLVSFREDILDILHFHLPPAMNTSSTEAVNNWDNEANRVEEE